MHFHSGYGNEYNDSAERMADCHGVFSHREVLMRDCARSSFFFFNFHLHSEESRLDFSIGGGHLEQKQINS